MVLQMVYPITKNITPFIDSKFLQPLPVRFCQTLAGNISLLLILRSLWMDNACEFVWQIKTTMAQVTPHRVVLIFNL